MPENTVKVDRTTAWGNPFKVGATLGAVPHWTVVGAELSPAEIAENVITMDISLRLFRAHLNRLRNFVEAARHHLAGKNLACWCKVGDPCHADVWLELLNPEP